MIEKIYDPSAIESHWYNAWENNHCFTPKGIGETFSIVIPPPNVTGSLHMGHAFQDTLMDILTRWKRMEGKNTLWLVGTDHAGIATQMVVERMLNAQKQTRHDLGREAFVERVWEWKNQSGNTISQQLRRLGASVDWTRERFTLDEGCSHAVQEVFVRLYEQGLIYRGKRLVNWDPNFQTAVSDLEVNNKEEQGSLWYIRYPLAEGHGHIIIATTRPETMFGDVAVAVHPDDPRYEAYIGKKILQPLTNREIPVIADETVLPDFGTGCVKITPAHDFNDYQMGLRHELPMINIFNKDASLNDEVPERFRGMDRFAARKLVIQLLTEQNLIEKIEPHTLSIPRADRGDTIVEPYLTDQWFVKMDKLAKPAIEAVQTGKIKFIPEHFETIYFNWLNNIEDWCISRQLWWGHRIPAWYAEDGKLYVGRSEAEVRQKHQLSESVSLTQDEDVLDTWFSSALWPFETMGWPDEKAADLKTFFPTSVLVTGFDIIFFWVARMIMMSLHFTGDIPFQTVYVHGLIQDAEGQKMSKSKGNVIDPIDLIDGITLDKLIEKRTYGLMQPELADKIKARTEKEYPNGIQNYGTDALRFTLASIAIFNQQIRFDVKRLEGYRNFCNKIWNAARFIFMNVEGVTLTASSENALHPIDKWIRARLDATITQVSQHLSNYRFDFAAQAMYEFVWYEFCDWYLELIKPRLQDPSKRAQICAYLVHIFDDVLRMMHPVIPFITEEIWQKLKPFLSHKDLPDYLIDAAYPVPENSISTEHSVEWLKSIVNGIRNIRSEMNVPPARSIDLYVVGASQQDKTWFDFFENELKHLIKLKTLHFSDSDADLKQCARFIYQNLTCLLPLADLIDKDLEMARLNKLISKLDSEHQKLAVRMQNPDFLNNAPADLVAKNHVLLAEQQQKLLHYQQELEKVKTL